MLHSEEDEATPGIFNFVEFDATEETLDYEEDDATKEMMGSVEGDATKDRQNALVGTMNIDINTYKELVAQNNIFDRRWLFLKC